MRNYLSAVLLVLAFGVVPLSATAAEELAVVQAPAEALVNLNTADAATLQQSLSGVGAVKAQAIVAHRETVGAFASVDQLLEVQGIGASIFEQNRSKLSVE